MGKVLINLSISFILVLIGTDIAQAQIQRPGITLGGYLLYARPKGDFKQIYNFGGGGEVFAGVGLGKTFIIGTAGFSAFKPQPSIRSGSLTYTPLKIGLKRFLFRKLLFINADLGRATVKNRNFKETRFTRGIGFGAKLLGLEAGLYYDGWKNINAGGFSNSVDVKVGWSLSL